ncbi:hypothetical protein MLC70_09480 [Marinobacter goseongensis]|nr:hypothetical protein [Marinobacter goseongensis]
MSHRKLMQFCVRARRQNASVNPTGASLAGMAAPQLSLKSDAHSGGFEVPKVSFIKH